MFRKLFSPGLRRTFHSRYVPERIPTASKHTLHSYKVTFNLLDRFLDRPAKLADLNDKTISRFRLWRLEHARKSTVRGNMACITAVWRWACLQRLVPKPPALTPLSYDCPTPVALTEEELGRVWRSIQDEPRPVITCFSPYHEVPGPVWWSAIFLVAWDTGERFTPIFNLLERNVDLERKKILFPAEDRKVAKDSQKPIHNQTAQALSELMGCYERTTHNTRVFRWALNRGTVWSQLGAIMQRAGLPDTREFKFHCLRKSHCSHALAAGASNPLDHTNQRVMREHYTDPRIVEPEQGINYLFRPGEAG